MYPQLNRMYDFIFYENKNIIPKSGSDDTFTVFLNIDMYDSMRIKYNVSIQNQKDSWFLNTKFVWIPGIPGIEYPNYLLPQVQFIGAVRSDRHLNNVVSGLFIKLQCLCSIFLTSII